MSRPAKAFFDLFGKVDGMTFLETGSYLGGGVLEAMRSGYGEIHSVEAVKEFYDICVGKFERQLREKLVTLHYGGSETVLPQLIPTFQGPVFFWLDAHFQGKDADMEVKACPLVEEVEAICQHRSNEDDVIFIDDIRILTRKRNWAKGVMFEENLGKLMSHYRNHFTCFVDGYCENDVFCIVPQKHAEAFFQIKERVNQAPRRADPYAAQAAAATAAATAAVAS